MQDSTNIRNITYQSLQELRKHGTDTGDLMKTVMCIMELRFYPDHSTAVSDGTPFAEDATGEDAKLKRQDTMWRVGLSDRKRSSSALDSHPIQRAQALEVRLAKYADYMIFNNVIMLCEGEDSNEAFKLCNDLIDLVSK